MVSLELITPPRTFMVGTLSAPLIVGRMWSVSTVERLLQTISSFVFDTLSFKLLLSAHPEMLSNSSCTEVMNREATIKYVSSAYFISLLNWCSEAMLT